MPYKDKEKGKARSKAYRESNRDAIAAQRKTHREAHKEEMKIKIEAYRKEHKEEIKAQKKEYSIANREKLRAQHKAHDDARRKEAEELCADYRRTHSNIEQTYDGSRSHTRTGYFRSTWGEAECGVHGLPAQ